MAARRGLGVPAIAIVDMSETTQFIRLHIPPARHLPYAVLNRQNQQQINLSIGPQNVTRFMVWLGITPQRCVVSYDDTGSQNAARLFQELERPGHQKNPCSMVAW